MTIKLKPQKRCEHRLSDIPRYEDQPYRCIGLEGHDQPHTYDPKRGAEPRLTVDSATAMN